MAKIKITIQDDFGKVITETADREYQLDLGKATLTEIEGAVEDFKKRALADIEKDFWHLSKRCQSSEQFIWRNLAYRWV